MVIAQILGCIKKHNGMWMHKGRNEIARKEYWNSGHMGFCKCRNEMRIEGLKEENKGSLIWGCLCMYLCLFL